MNYFLDTNTCIYFLNGSSKSVKENILSKEPQQIKIPSIVKAELLCGAENSAKCDDNLRKLGLFLLPFEIVSFTDASTASYARIRNSLTKKGKLVGPNDMLIASIVHAERGILVTNNVKEFSYIENIEIENWFN